MRYFVESFGQVRVENKYVVTCVLIHCLVNFLQEGKHICSYRSTSNISMLMLFQVFFKVFI